MLATTSSHLRVRLVARQADSHSDEELIGNVIRTLKEEHNDGLDVTVRRGVICVTGNIGAAAAHWRIVDRLGSLPGARGIELDVRVV